MLLYDCMPKSLILHLKVPYMWLFFPQQHLNLARSSVLSHALAKEPPYAQENLFIPGYASIFRGLDRQSPVYTQGQNVSDREQKARNLKNNLRFLQCFLSSFIKLLSSMIISKGDALGLCKTV